MEANHNKANEKQVKAAVEEISDKMIRQGSTAKDAMDIDPEFMENLYSQGYQLYNTGKYLDAAHLFRKLILLNSFEPKYTMGLAACFHMLKEYDHAIQSYTVCSLIDPQNPLPHYHASDCYAELNDYFSSIICLDLTIKLCGDRPEFSKVKERSILTLNSLKERLEENKK